MNDYLNWELHILARSIAHPNLSAAAAHVGVSQPQLSRIITKLEESWGVSLLDRSSRRRSAWTPDARRLVETYQSAQSRFAADVKDLVEGSLPTSVTFGTLEGLIPLALEIVNRLYQARTIQTVEVLVLDLSELEERFHKGELGLILSLRPPGRKKHARTRQLGTQSLDPVKMGKAGTRVLSPYESATQPRAKSARRSTAPIEARDAIKTLISPSLLVRKLWLEAYGGQGVLPGRVHPTGAPPKAKAPGATQVPVLLIGADSLHESLWRATRKTS